MIDRFHIGLSGCGGGFESVSSDEIVQLAQDAERLGFDAIWLNEEHLHGSNLEAEGRRCLSPLILASAILARTRTLRVGFSVLLLPLHHPIRLAEDIATLDVLSGGRVDLGISRGGNGRFMAAYGISRDEMDKRFDDTLETVLKAWKGPMDFGGTMESVEPKPVQRPHPPIFVGTHTPATVEWTARSGYSLICHGITNAGNVQRLLQSFKDAGGDPGKVPVGRFVYVSETDRSARRELWPVILRLTARMKSVGLANRAAVLTEHDLEPETFYREMVIAGGPETCTAKIEEMRRAWGMNYLNALSAFFGFLPLPELRRSLRLLAEEVRPRLQAV